MGKLPLISTIDIEAEGLAFGALNNAEDNSRVKNSDTRHASDCAMHNEPAFPAGPCDCGAQGGGKD